MRLIIEGILASIEVTPQPAQGQALFCQNKVVLVAGGERAGKSFTSAIVLVIWTILDLVNLGPGRLYWIVGPDYVQCHREFDYAAGFFYKLGMVLTDNRPKDGSWQMTLKGGVTIITKTSEDPKALANDAPDGVLMVEAAQQTFDTYEKLFNRLAESRGRGSGHFYISGTFEKSLGWYPEIFNLFQGDNLWGGKSFSLPSWENLTVFPGGYDDEEMVRLRGVLPKETFDERFGGVPCPPRELVFKEFRHYLHVVNTRWGDVKVPVRDEKGWLLPKDGDLELWIDPGYAGAYAVLFVYVFAGLVFIVDEVYAQGKVGEIVIQETIAKRDLFQRVKRGVMDVAGRQHNAMESQEELWLKHAKLPMFMEPVPIVDGILRHRTFLTDPMTMAPRMYHDPKCKGTIREYELYRYPEAKENRDERELPIDANNHSMKAIAYGLWNRFSYVDTLHKSTRRSVIRNRSSY